MKLWLAKEPSAPEGTIPKTNDLGAGMAGPHAGLKLHSDQPSVLAAFANAPFYGDGMKIAPHARLDDGLFDVCLIRGIDKFKLFCLFPSVYFGGHLGLKEVEYFHSARAVVETEYPLDVYADGEYVCKTPVEFRVERAALRVIIPRESS